MHKECFPEKNEVKATEEKMNIAIHLQAIDLHRKMLKETLEFPNIKTIKSRLVDLFRHLRLDRLISMCLF